MPYESDRENMSAIEAVLFASGYPVKISMLADVLSLDEEKIRDLIHELAQSYEGRGIELAVLEDECQLCSRAEYEESVRAALGIRRGTKLSPALLEVLSIVAYRQPVTRAYIEQVRGVDCSYSITSLLDKGMIENKGHLELPGRPAIYGTTPDFLRVFGIASLGELPPIELFDAIASGGDQKSDSVGSSAEDDSDGGLSLPNENDDTKEKISEDEKDEEDENAKPQT